MHYHQINQTIFDPANPFDLSQPIFSFGNDARFKDLSEGFYKELLVWIFNAEYEATIAYSAMIEKIQFGKDDHFKSLPNNDQIWIKNYLEEMLQEEIEHTAYFSNLLTTIYGDSILPVIDKTVLDSKTIIYKQYFEEKNLIDILAQYYIGESWLWVVFYTFYKISSGDKKEILKKLIVDEAGHINKMFMFIKKMSNDSDINLDSMLEICKSLRYLGLEYFEENFNQTNVYSTFIKRKFYDCEYQKNFNKLVTEKWYELYSYFSPKATYDDFRAIVNFYDRNRLQFC